MRSLSNYSPLILRVGVASAILWFGLNQLFQPELWTIWVPTWAEGFGLTPLQIVYGNGAFETLASLCLIFGIYVRPIALLMVIHVATIIFDIGLSAIGVRDTAIAAAFLAVATNGSDEFSLKG